MRADPPVRFGIPWAALAALLLGACVVPEAGPGDLVPAPSGLRDPNAEPGNVAGGVTTTHTYDPGHDLQLDLYRPPGGTGPNPPVIVSLHGGGWTSGSRAGPEPALLAQVGRGFVVAAVDYRLAFTDPFPAAVLDIKRAIQWIGTQPGYEASPVVVAGSSAGGNLAVLVAVSSGVEALEPVPGRRTVVAAAVSIDGPQDLRALRQPPWLDLTWAMDDLPPGPAHDHYGARIESGESVPAYLGCREPGAGCDRLVGERIAPASTTTWIDGGDPPVYLVCLAANTVLPDCAHDAGPFAVAYVAAHGGSPASAWVDLIRSPAANHFIAGAFVNLTALNHFLDRFGR